MIDLGKNINNPIKFSTWNLVSNPVHHSVRNSVRNSVSNSVSNPVWLSVRRGLPSDYR